MTTQAYITSVSQNGWLLSLHRKLLFGALLLISICASVANAGYREQALQIHNRIAGVPPSEAVLLLMAQDIEDGKIHDAVDRAMENEAFYSVTLKNMATPWTNREQTVFAPLNDYTATFIGLVKEEADFRTILFEDVLFISNAGGLPAYSNTNNAHYEAIETQGISLKDTLTRRTQSSLNGLPSAATSGVLTSRAAAKAFFIAGTNRAMFRFTLMNHLCRDLEQVHDTSRVPDRIRQDVSRSPGGDSRVFLNSCIGCHNGMDPMAQAYAYYDFEFDSVSDPEALNGRIHYNVDGTVDPDTGSRVEKKYLINSSTFRYGFVTQNDQWTNYWRAGQNASLEWGNSLPGSDYGAKSLGMELANSRAFAQCQVEKVFTNVCLRRPADDDDRGAVDLITDSFISSEYKLKQVFREVANHCKAPRVD